MKWSGILLLSFTLGSCGSASADWKDLLGKVPDSLKGGETTGAAAEALGLSREEIVAGLKEALDKATGIAVNNLGREGGFLDNPSVRIPMPQELDWVEKGLRKVGQDQLADEFVGTMNHAAEQAVPMALEQFQSAISAMSLEDAKAILDGPDDAATRYFRKHSEASLREQFLPIVEKTTESAGVTASYKDMTEKVGGLSALLNTQAPDLDGYVTDKALDGLFLIVAEQEAAIRQDPVARTTDLLKKVFSGS